MRTTYNRMVDMCLVDVAFRPRWLSMFSLSRHAITRTTINFEVPASFLVRSFIFHKTLCEEARNGLVIAVLGVAFT